MITFNNIVERFEDFATSHFFIKSFSFGSPDDVDLAKFTEFPLMHLVYTGATYDSGTKTYNIEVYILDVPADKTDKVERQREVVSDAEQCAEDIIADIRMGGNIFTFAQDYEVVNATTTPLEEETKNVLSGVLLDLSVAIPYEWDACNAPIDGVSPEGGDKPSYARRGFLRMLTLDGSTDVLSVRTIKVTNGTLTDDGEGVVTLDTGGVETLEDLTDTNIISPEQGSVISYNSGVQKWMVNNGLQELLQKFKASGTGAQMYDTLNDTTKGYIDILASSATMKVNHSGMTISEASPGVLSFSVAAGTEGNEVEFEAMTIEGSDAVSTVADINFKQGALTYWENSTGKIWLRAPNAGNLTVLLPSSSGTIALTTDIPNVPVDSVNGQTGVVVLDTGDIDENGNLYYTEARVAANAAVAANTAKVGITQTQADDITANNAKTGITAQQATDITTNNAKVGVIAGGTTGQALVKASGTDYDTEWAEIAIDTQYHNRFQTDAETFRSGATDTVELYYTAKADGDGLAESASSDTPTAGKIIRRKIYYSEAAFADPDTGTWVEFTPAPADDASFATVKAALLEYLKARTGGTVPISLKQTWEEVTAAPAFTGLLNESYGSGAAAAYGTRRLNGNYSGACMTIRRASDGTTQTIGFVGEEIDESAITTFCTGSTCTVQVWHDQSQTGGTGSGNDAEQTTPANQPTIYTGGQLVKDGGRLALRSQAGNIGLTASVAGQTNFYAFSIVKTETRSIFVASANSWMLPAQIGSTTTAQASGATINNIYVDGNSYTWSNWGDWYNELSSQKLFTLDASNGSWGDLDFGWDASTNFGMYTMQEFVLYNSDKSTDRTDIEGNISAYYQSAKLLDEQYGSGAEAAYSVRQLKRDNTECMVIRRASDSTTTTIGFDSEGNIDEAAIETFCTGTSCTVYQWLDQSGNGNTATAGATEPIIYTGGAIVKDEGKVAINFNAAYSALKYTGQDLNLSAVTALVVQRIDTTSSVGGYPIALQNTNNDGLRMFLRNYGLRNRTTGTNLDVSFPQELYFTRNLADIASSTSALKVTFNGAVTATASGKTFSTNGLDLAVGGSSFDTVEHRGSMQEAIIFGVDKYTSGDIDSIRENVGDYFTQNTPLLDTYTGAAAAYSLRRLSSSYVGSAVEVYNGSSYADIGFDVFGELNTVALAAHCGSNDGFIRTWYDQAGSNDAAQGITANMPKIYDGATTSVVTENGKPALDFTNAVNLFLKNSSGQNLSISATDYSFIFVQKRASATGWIFDSQTGRFVISSGSPSGLFFDGAWKGSQQTTTAHEINYFDFVSPSSTNYYVNGSLNQGSLTYTQKAIGGLTAIGREYSGSVPMNGTLQEFIIYTTPQTSYRTGIESNIATFYDITI